MYAWCVYVSKSLYLLDTILLERETSPQPLIGNLAECFVYDEF